MTTADPLDFYFDFASPYGYLAARFIDGLAGRHGRSVRWRPILLGAVFKVTGVKPNMLQPLRGDYLKHDIVRSARLLGQPLTFPKVMPVNGLAASRAYYWVEQGDPSRARALARAIYDAHWAEGRDVGPAQTVAEIASDSLGIDPAALLDGIGHANVKERLRVETDQAISRGVFGAPFIFVDDEPFWGADRLEQIDRWLTSGGW